MIKLETTKNIYFPLIGKSYPWSFGARSVDPPPTDSLLCFLLGIAQQEAWE